MNSQTASQTPNPLRDSTALDRRHSADELKLIAADTRALTALAANEIAARMIGGLRAKPSAQPDHAALLGTVRSQLVAARDALTDDANARVVHRFACDALHLHRACPRAKCRKARRCRGNAIACYTRAHVPEKVADRIAALLLAQDVPWSEFANDKSAEREAYACWVAGIEARR